MVEHGRWLIRWWCVLGALALFPAPRAEAKIPEPFHVLYGAVKLDGAPLTQGVVELIPVDASKSIARYAIGSVPDAAGMYVLRVPIDSVEPREPGFAQPGDEVEVYVNGLYGGRAVVGEKGTAQELAVEATSEHRIGFPKVPGGMPNPCESGASVAISVEARDTQGHALTYAWSAACPGLASGGRLDDAAKAATLWTAPANLTGAGQDCVLTVAANDGKGASETRQYHQLVRPLLHSIVFSSGPGGTPNPVASEGTVGLAVTAVDSYEHSLTLEWSAVCPGLPSTGRFVPGAIGAVSWTAPVNPTGAEASCTLLVHARDEFGHSAQGFYTQRISPADHAIAFVAAASGTPNPVEPGGVVHLTADAVDTSGHALTYLWKATCAGLGSNGSFSNAASRTPTWTAPANPTADPVGCTVAVTAADGTGLTAVSSYRQGIFGLMPTAVATVDAPAVTCPAAVRVDGSGSYHANPGRSIVTYEWDFHYDGANFRTEATGVALSYAYGEVGTWTVGVRVTDDAAPPQSAIGTVDVSVGGAAPIASAGGPYTGAIGAPLALDGTGSSDPDGACADRIAEYVWDLDGDGAFDDAQGPAPKLPWALVKEALCGLSCTTGVDYPVVLRVTDRLGMTAESASTIRLTDFEGVVRLTAPNGGEMLGAGSTYPVTFLTGPEVDSVRLFLSQTGGRTWNILKATGTQTGVVADGVSEGQRNLKVPVNPLAVSRDALVKVTGFASGVPVGSDTSDAPFAFGPLDVAFPEQGASVPGGETAQVRWRQFGTIRPVAAARLAYSLDDGREWKQAGTRRIGPEPVFAWQVPALKKSAHRCRVRVELLDAKGGLVGSDQSEGNFTILGGVEVVAPEVGDGVYGGTNRAVRWVGGAPAARTRISYSLDGGATWSVAGQAVGNPGVWYWAAPEVNEAKTRCKVAVALLDAGGKVIGRDVGEGYFSLLPK
jgi:hypothetical protein